MAECKARNIVINYKRCKACGICIAFCPKNVFDKNENGKPIMPRIDQCIGCGLCELRCPDFAVQIGGEV